MVAMCNLCCESESNRAAAIRAGQPTPPPHPRLPPPARPLLRIAPPPSESAGHKDAPSVPPGPLPPGSGRRPAHRRSARARSAG